MKPINKAVLRPALRYHGSKWMLAPWILSLMPPHHSYVEPYGGGAAVLLRKPRSRFEVYNDLDGDVVNLFRVLRDPSLSQRLAEAVRLTPFARAEWEAARDGTSDDPVERARLLLIRAFMGHGGDAVANRSTGFRATGRRDGGSTTPRDWDRWPAHVGRFAARLKGVVIECKPAIDVIRQQDRADTMFYVDPPYPHESRTGWQDGRTHGYAHEMSDQDHRELAEVLWAVAGMVMLSGYHCDLNENLYGGWPFIEHRAFADGAGADERTEVLWFNDAAWSARPSLFVDGGRKP